MCIPGRMFGDGSTSVLVSGVRNKGEETIIMEQAHSDCKYTDGR